MIWTVVNRNSYPKFDLLVYLVRVFVFGLFLISRLSIDLFGVPTAWISWVLNHPTISIFVSLQRVQKVNQDYQDHPWYVFNFGICLLSCCACQCGVQLLKMYYITFIHMPEASVQSDVCVLRCETVCSAGQFWKRWTWRFTRKTRREGY